MLINNEKHKIMKAYQLENGTKFITDYPNDTPSDDNVSFEESFYQESNQSITGAYKEIINGNYTELDVDDISEFGQEEEKEWLQKNYA